MYKESYMTLDPVQLKGAVDHFIKRNASLTTKDISNACKNDLETMIVVGKSLMHHNKLGRPLAFLVFHAAFTEFNDSSAAFNMAQLLISGFQGLDPNPEAAEEILEKLSVDHPASQYLLGMRLATRDANKSLDLLEKAANNNHPHALLQMSLLSSSNEIKALEYCSRAADLQLVEAIYQLATYYSKGIGTSKNQEKAIELIEKAANKGLACAQHDFGAHLMESKDEFRAVEYWKMAAEQNFEPSLLNLGLFYSKKNPKRALQYLTRLESLNRPTYSEQATLIVKSLEPSNKCIIL